MALGEVCAQAELAVSRTSEAKATSHTARPGNALLVARSETATVAFPGGELEDGGHAGGFAHAPFRGVSPCGRCALLDRGAAPFDLVRDVGVLPEPLFQRLLRSRANIARTSILDALDDLTGALLRTAR